MGNTCSRCCGKIQDCCRDWCGCCPCRCCKATRVEMTLKTIDDKIIKKKDIPYGFGRIYAGVHKADNSYTSPILEIHTWQEELMQTKMNMATVDQRIALGGMQTERDNADHRLGPMRRAERRKIDLNEEILCIPIESIISIKYSGEIKKELTEQIHSRLKTARPPVKLSCCGKVKQCCCKTFCCCCIDSKVNVDPVRTIAQIVDEKSTRVILITIEYIRYNNINTPSYFNALATTDANVYYKEHLQTVTLEFYLLNNQVFEQSDFDLKRAQGAALCRLVTHLKALAGQYPDESTLRNIISKQEIQAIGDPPQETLNKLVGGGSTMLSLTARVPTHTTQN